MNSTNPHVFSLARVLSFTLFFLVHNHILIFTIIKQLLFYKNFFYLSVFDSKDSTEYIKYVWKRKQEKSRKDNEKNVVNAFNTWFSS